MVFNGLFLCNVLLITPRLLLRVVNLVRSSAKVLSCWVIRVLLYSKFWLLFHEWIEGSYRVLFLVILLGPCLAENLLWRSSSSLDIYGFNFDFLRILSNLDLFPNRFSFIFDFFFFLNLVLLRKEIYHCLERVFGVLNLFLMVLNRGIKCLTLPAEISLALRSAHVLPDQAFLVELAQRRVVLYLLRLLVLNSF